MTTVDRRTFLKAAGSGVGTLALTGDTPLAATPAARPARRAVAAANSEIVVVGADAFGGWTALYLRDHDPDIRRVLVLCGSGLERELRDAGYDVVTSGVAATRMSQEPIDGFAAAGNPDAVVVGLDPNLTFSRLVVASDSIRAGAHFIATNRDPVYPTERGLRPGAGSIVMLLEVATGIVPVSIGKPAPYLLEAAAHAVGREPGEAIMIGDGIATDLAAARAVGARCVLMLTGVSTRVEVEALPADQQPTAVAADADELAATLERLAAG